MMRRFFRGLWAALTTPWVLALFVTLFLIGFVWLAGPYVAIADNILLESVTARLVVTICLLFFWGLFVALFYSRRKKKEQSDPEKVQEAETKIVKNTAFKEEIDSIKDKIKSAIRIVTHSNFYSSTGRSRYGLPWYVVIGTENSGKTSLLLNSGLQFPLNEQADRHLYSLRATEHCETFFANQAVFIDTPGSYTKAQQNTNDNKFWVTLLRRLFHVRPAKALNGIIVCLSMREIMDTDVAAREHAARTIRTRLSEVLKHSRVDAPVYLVFTKCDAVPGFAQYFAHLSRAEREQIFGCPLEGLGLEGTNVRSEIKLVMEKLNTQIIAKIHQERDVFARGDLFRFPQEMASLGSRIEDFIHEAFGHSRYYKPVMFRGFFFTSALSVHDVLAASSPQGELSFQSGFQASLGDYAKGFFILRLLQDLIIPEARLAGTDKEHMWALRLRRYGTQLAAGALFLFSVGFLGVSFMNNYSKVGDIDAIHQEFTEKQKTIVTPPDSRSVLPELNTLETTTAVFEPEEDSPVSYGLGLYQGDSFEKATHQAYLSTLNKRLVPLLRQEAARKVESSLTDISELKPALSAYIMLCQPKYIDKIQLTEWLARQWSRQYHGDAVAQNTLTHHTDYLIDNGITPVEPNADLLARARQALLKIPLAEIAYQQMKEEAASSGKSPFSFRAQLGDVMSPFEGDTYEIASLYTREGYEEYCIKRCPIIIKNLTTDSWVFGSNPISLSALDMDKIYKEVRWMYFRDYSRYWSEALQSLTIRVPQNLSEASKTAEQMTVGISPVTLVLREVQKHTSLVIQAGDENDALETAVKDEAQRRAGRAAGRVTGARVGGALAEKGKTAAEEARAKALEETQRDAKSVAAYFTPLVGLLDAEGNPGPNLRAAHDAMATTSSYFKKMLGDATNQRVFAAVIDIADGRDDTLMSLENSAEKLPAPVRAWYETIASEGFKRMLQLAAANINQTYKERVVSVYTRNLSGYYPFNSGSGVDVNLDNFSSFFKAGGVLDSFYSSHIQPFTNANGSMRTIMGRTLPLSSGALAQVARANRVQNAFFTSGRDLGISFKLEPYALDATLKQVDLAGEGKTLSYWHGPVKGESYSWPQSGGGTSSASLSIVDLNGVPTRKETKGEWALFRILQMGTIKRQEGNTCMLEVQINGKWAQFLILFRNRLNPFDPSVCSFTLPAGLQ